MWCMKRDTESLSDCLIFHIARKGLQNHRSTIVAVSATPFRRRRPGDAVPAMLHQRAVLFEEFARIEGLPIFENAEMKVRSSALSCIAGAPNRGGLRDFGALPDTDLAQMCIERLIAIVMPNDDIIAENAVIPCICDNAVAGRFYRCAFIDNYIDG